MVTMRLVRAADVVAARIDRSRQVDDGLGGSQQGADLQPRRQQAVARNTSQVTTDAPRRC